MKTTKIAVAIIIFILIEFAAYIYLESLHKVGINHFLSEKTKELQTKQKAVQNTYILMIENILHQEINKPEILRIFSQAQFADSLTKIILRDSIYKKLLPVYSFLRTSHINQLHFHLPNNASFLRFHRPETYGDDLTNIRYSIKMTNLNKKSYQGFEAGRAYIGFRNIFPLFYDNLHIGSVEISFSFENIKNQLRQHEDVFYGLLIKKDVLNKKVFANEKNKYALSTISEEYMYEKKYIPYENDRLNLIDQDVQTEINTYFAKNENFTVFKIINDDYYLISFISVNNIQGLPVAYIFSYKKDITIAKYQDNNSRTHIIAAILIALIAFFMVIALLKNDKVREIYNDYRDILDANLDIIFMVNVFGKQLYFNKQIKNLLGYDRDEVTGKMFTNFIPTSEIPKYLEKLKEVFLHKEIAPFETIALHKDGRLIPVEITGKVMKYNGEIVGVGTIKDISERKKAEKKLDHQKKEYLAVNEELRQNIEVLSISNKQIESQYKYIEESEAEYRALINSTTEGYWLVDTKDITSDVNNSICEMLGYTRKEMLGRNLYEFLDDKNKKRLNVSIIQHREKNIKQYEVAFQSKSGKNIPVIINAASLFDREGNKTKSFAFITNISTRKKEEQKLLESREHLKKAQEVGKIGSWEWDIKKNEILWSDMTFKIFG
ncbi:MAG: PAS domain S-box protein, partial [Bacteroidales bacterium]|nr:PAS domain S-box protein [Bacteroidales bacterium]